MSKKSIQRSILFLVIGSTLFFLNQNCNKAGFDSALDVSSLGTVDTVVSGAPFAFKAGFDQIAYNSCAGASAPNTSGFFTFKVGAYSQNSGGVSLNSSILDYANTHLRPIYPASTISRDQVKNLISNSPNNMGYTAQLSLRPLDNLSVLGSTRSTRTVGIDYIYLLDSLTDDRWLESVTPSDVSISSQLLVGSKYFPYAPTYSSRVFESKISFNSSFVESNNLRDAMMGQEESGHTFALTLGFVKQNGQAETLQGLTSDSQKASATAYQMNFTQVDPGAESRNPSNFLNGINEDDLSSGAANSGLWSCDIAVEVVAPADAAKYCPKDTTLFNAMGSSDSLSLQKRQELIRIRRALSTEYWDVNYVGSGWCAVPKDTGKSCYSAAFGTVTLPVEYDRNNICYDAHYSTDDKVQAAYNLTMFTDANGSNPFRNSNGTIYWQPDGVLKAAKQCAQYVSICHRTQ